MMANWMLMHFPCGGEAERKAGLMRRYVSSENTLWEQDPQCLGPPMSDSAPSPVVYRE